MESEKTYWGVNTGAGPQMVWVIEGDSKRPLPHHVRHSPDGFQWGYAGSGPSDLARAILIDYLPEQMRGPANRLYQAFKNAWVAPQGVHFSVRSCDIDLWLTEMLPDLVPWPLDEGEREQLAQWLEAKNVEVGWQRDRLGSEG